MRTPLRYLSVLALSAMVSGVSGCAGFFVPPTTSTGSGSGSGGSSSGSTTSYAYVANATTNNIAGYALTSGTLAAVSGSPYSLGISPTSLVVTPANTFLYVGSVGAIFGYSINTTTGALTGVSSGQALAAVTGVSMDVSPDGNWLLVLDSGGLTVDEYAINTSTGVLTAATGAAFSVAGSGTTAPRAIRFAPSGGYVFAALGTGGDAIFTFNTSTGALVQTQSVGGSTTTSDNAVLVDSTSSHLYVARSGTNAGVYGYTIGSSGALTSLSGSPYSSGTDRSR